MKIFVFVFKWKNAMATTNHFFFILYFYWKIKTNSEKMKWNLNIYMESKMFEFCFLFALLSLLFLWYIPLFPVLNSFSCYKYDHLNVSKSLHEKIIWWLGTFWHCTWTRTHQWAHLKHITTSTMHPSTYIAKPITQNHTYSHLKHARTHTHTQTVCTYYLKEKKNYFNRENTTKLQQKPN